AAEDSRRLAEARARPRHLDGVVAEVRQREVAEERAAVRVRVRAHAPLAARGQLGELGGEPAAVVEELLRPVAPHPLLEDLQVLRVLARAENRDLVRPPRAL